eukprot:3406237-Rhodomonas_salina.2
MYYNLKFVSQLELERRQLSACVVAGPASDLRAVTGSRAGSHSFGSEVAVLDIALVAFSVLKARKALQLQLHLIPAQTAFQRRTPNPNHRSTNAATRKQTS